MVKHLKDKIDVGLSTSIQSFMNSCYAFDLSMPPNEIKKLKKPKCKRLECAEFTRELLRFFKPPCQDHNLEIKNYIKAQTGGTSTINIIISTAD